jgi:prepilin-type N-terminal cleavage/methylation domain-containing protein
MNRHHPTARSSISPRLGLGLLGQCINHRPASQSDQRSGFTLIESLVAIIVITITVVSVIPPIFWATATRVQNRRVEQAVQLAQGEIDRVRSGIERRDFDLVDLPPQAGNDIRPNAPAPTTIDTAKLRSISPTCNPTGDGRPPSQVNAVIPVDTDPGDNCKPEFFIQVFRGRGVTLSTLPGALPEGIVMGVRVYSIAATRNGTTLNPGLETKPGAVRTTNGLGTQRTRPIAVQYSVITRSNASDGLSLYRQLCAQLGDGCFSPN